MTYPTLTPAEFRAQGTSPGSILSIAGYNQRLADRERSPTHMEIARRLRLAAREVAILLGIELPKRGRRGVNDNRRQRQRGRAA